MQILILAYIFFFGAIIGSFLNVVILRLPQNRKLTGRSSCTHCGHILSPLELVPLVSFLALRGKCHSCKEKISSRYFFIEFITGFLFALSWYLSSPVLASDFMILARNLFFIAVCIVVFIIDLEHYLILDVVIFPSFITVAIFNLCVDITAKNSLWNIHSYFLSGFGAALLSPLPFLGIWYFSKGKWMGFGDVKLMLFLGAALGLPLVWVGIMLGILAGGAAAVFLLGLGTKNMKSQVPFGTFLTIGCLISLWFGQSLLHWYLALLGL